MARRAPSAGRRSPADATRARPRTGPGSTGPATGRAPTLANVRARVASPRRASTRLAQGRREAGVDTPTITRRTRAWTTTRSTARWPRRARSSRTRTRSSRCSRTDARPSRSGRRAIAGTSACRSGRDERPRTGAPRAARPAARSARAAVLRARVEGRRRDHPRAARVPARPRGVADRVRAPGARGVRAHRRRRGVPTNAQGLALARFLRPAFRDKTIGAAVSRGSAGLPDDYLFVRLTDGYEGGIAPDGRVST